MDMTLHDERCPGCRKPVDMELAVVQGDILWMCPQCGTSISTGNLDLYRQYLAKMTMVSAAAHCSREKHSA